MVRTENVAQALAVLLEQRINCIKAKNDIWLGICDAAIKAIVGNQLPHGAGIDSEVVLEINDGSKLVFAFGFHHMNDGGYYDGWTQHRVTVRPSWQGIGIDISGRDRNGIKEYLHQTWDCALTAPCRQYGESGAEYVDINVQKAVDAERNALTTA